MISLAPGFICRLELLLLLLGNFLAPVHQIGSLLAGLTGALGHEFAAFTRLGAEGLTRLAAGMRRIQHSDRRTNAEPREKP
jgi:hypothetical protein